MGEDQLQANTGPDRDRRLVSIRWACIEADLAAKKVATPMINDPGANRVVSQNTILLEEDGIDETCSTSNMPLFYVLGHTTFERIMPEMQEMLEEGHLEGPTRALKASHRADGTCRHQGAYQVTGKGLVDDEVDLVFKDIIVILALGLGALGPSLHASNANALLLPVLLLLPWGALFPFINIPASCQDISPFHATCALCKSEKKLKKRVFTDPTPGRAACMCQHRQCCLDN